MLVWAFTSSVNALLAVCTVFFIKGQDIYVNSQTLAAQNTSFEDLLLSLYWGGTKPDSVGIS